MKKNNSMNTMSGREAVEMAAMPAYCFLELSHLSRLILAARPQKYAEGTPNERQ